MSIILPCLLALKMESLPCEIFEYLIGLITDAETIQTVRLVSKKWKTATLKIRSLIWPESYDYPRRITGERLTPLFPALQAIIGRTVIYSTPNDVPLTIQCGHLTMSYDTDDLEWTDGGEHGGVNFDINVADELTLLHRQLKIHGLAVDLRLDIFSLNRNELHLVPGENAHMLHRFDCLATALINDYVKLCGDKAIITLPRPLDDIPYESINELHIATDWKYGIDGYGAMTRWAVQLSKARLAILHTRKTIYAFPPRSTDEIEEGWARSPSWLDYDMDSYQWIVK